MGYQPKTYRDKGGDRMVVVSGGEIRVDSGGKVTNAGVQAVKIADPTGGATVDAESRTAINAIIDALEGVGISAAV